MVDSSKYSGRLKPSKPILKVIDLGLCRDDRCSSWEVVDSVLEPHSHGLVYAPGVADEDLLALMYRVMGELDFKGELEVEHVSRAEWNRRSQSSNARLVI